MRKRIYAVQAKSEGFDLLTEIIVSMLLSVGIAGILCNFTVNTAAKVFAMAVAAVYSAVTAVIRKKPFALGIFHGVTVIAFALLSILTFRLMQTAMLNSVNVVIANINEVFEKNIALLGVSESSTWAMAELYGILAALTAMAVSFLVNRKAIIAITALSFAAIFAGMLLTPNSTAVILAAFIGLIGCWGLCISGSGSGLVKICAVLAAISVLGLIIAAKSGFSGFRLIDNVHKDTGARLHEIRFGSDSLPHGDMAKARDMLNSDDDTLLVTFTSPEAMYLKGFTGTDFEESKWQEYEPDRYAGKWNGMLDYFRDNKFSVQRMYDEYLRADGNEIKYDIISIENNGADRSYVYLPFTAAEVNGSSPEYYKDLSTKSSRFFGAKKYGFDNIKTDTAPEMLNPSSWINRDNTDSEKQKYKDNENAYRAFAKESYLQLDDLTREEINEVFYKNFEEDINDVGIYTITSRIRTILSLVTDYEAYPEKPEDKDFIGWFLGSYKKGNSAYYATAAVMAYRGAGIPARYAEGYYISESEAAALRETGVNAVQLTGKNAHAWAEIYRDGIGWISVEVTPGCYTENMSMDEIIDISRNIGDIGGINGRGSEHYTSSLSMYSPEKADYDDRVNSLISILVILLLILVIAGTILYIRYILLTHKKYDIIYGQSNEDTAEHMLEYMCAALNADGIKANPDHPNGFREELLEKYDDFVPQEFDRVIELSRRSSYGGMRLKEHEYRTIRIFIEKLYRDVYKDKNILQKLILRYIKVI